MIIPIFLAWLVGVSLAIWWPRSATDNPARARSYRLLARAASCYVLGFICLALLIVLTSGSEFQVLLLVLLAFLVAISLTPFAIGMLGLDTGFRWLGLTGGALSALFPAGIACYSVLVVIAVFMGGAPWWWGIASLCSALLCGASTWLVLEAYAVMRAPRVSAGGEAE